MSWRDRLLIASFRGIPFHITTRDFDTGRRGPLHEYPKREAPYAEDMGRRARLLPASGYVIGDNYRLQAAALIAACEVPGPGTFIHPSLGAFQVRCDSCVMSENEYEGRMARFSFVFVEAGSPGSFSVSVATGAVIISAASIGLAAVTSSLNRALSRL